MPTPNAPAGEFKTFYQTTGMAPVRMIQIVSLAFCVTGIGLAYMLYTAPAQQSISTHSQATWAAILFALALGAPIAAWRHGRRLAARLCVSADGRTLRIFELGLFGLTSRDVAVADVVLSAMEPGDAAGETALAPGRLEIAVRNDRSFIVALDKGKKQRDAIFKVLRP